MPPLLGVLALQGDFSRHQEVLRRLGTESIEVRKPADLSPIRALVIPGGESSTMSKLLLRWEIMDPLRQLIAQGLPVLATCAGLILLADRLKGNPSLPRLGGLGISVHRNAYGRQINSFEASLQIKALPSPASPFRGIFIRAPQILREEAHPDVQILSSFNDSPVLVRQGNILGSCFHPELSHDDRIHAWFLAHCLR